MVQLPSIPSDSAFVSLTETHIKLSKLKPASVASGLIPLDPRTAELKADQQKDTLSPS